MLVPMPVAPAPRLALLGIGLLACTSVAPGDEASEADTSGGEVGEVDPIPDACLIGGEAPRTIDEVVARIEALPHPVSIPCVLASLPRPLTLVATNSVFSVQPAKGDDNPRLFILEDGLVLSVVPTGDGSELLELSEFVSPTQTLKAEIEFPVDGPISAELPYEHEFYEGLTSCGVCHRDEYESPDRPGAYVSVALRPAPDTLVPVSSLGPLLDGCDWEQEPARCELLSGLLDFGPVEQGAFADELPTIFD